MTKPREKTREELQAEIEGAKDPPIKQQLYASAILRAVFFIKNDILKRKKHFTSSDCLISKGDTRLWQKDL